MANFLLLRTLIHKLCSFFSPKPTIAKQGKWGKTQLQMLIIKVKPLLGWRWNPLQWPALQLARKTQLRLSQCLSLLVHFCYWPLLKSLLLKFCLLFLGWKCCEGKNKWTRTLTCQKRVLFPTIILAKRASSTAKRVYNPLYVVLHTTIALHMSHHRLLQHQPDNRWRQKETYHGGILITAKEKGWTICLLLLGRQCKLHFKTPLFC